MPIPNHCLNCDKPVTADNERPDIHDKCVLPYKKWLREELKKSRERNKSNMDTADTGEQSN